MTFNRDNDLIENQKEYYKSQDVMRENKYRERLQELPMHEYNREGINISEIIRNMVVNNKLYALYFKEQINYDKDINDIAEDILVQAITPQGWDFPLTSSENFNIHINDLGHEIKIEIELYEEE